MTKNRTHLLLTGVRKFSGISLLLLAQLATAALIFVSVLPILPTAVTSFVSTSFLNFLPLIVGAVIAAGPGAIAALVLGAVLLSGLGLLMVWPQIFSEIKNIFQKPAAPISSVPSATAGDTEVTAQVVSTLAAPAVVPAPNTSPANSVVPVNEPAPSVAEPEDFGEALRRLFKQDSAETDEGLSPDDAASRTSTERSLLRFASSDSPVSVEELPVPSPRASVTSARSAPSTTGAAKTATSRTRRAGSMVLPAVSSDRDGSSSVRSAPGHIGRKSGMRLFVAEHQEKLSSAKPHELAEYFDSQPVRRKPVDVVVHRTTHKR